MNLFMEYFIYSEIFLYWDIKYNVRQHVSRYSIDTLKQGR